MTHYETPCERPDIYQKITDQIITAIEAGASDFQMPWHCDGCITMPVNAFSEQPYNGINIVALWVAAETLGFGSGFWATYKQWNLLGAQVRRGEKGNAVVFYKKTKRDVTDPTTGKPETKTFSFARASFVFNADQVDGWYPVTQEVTDPAVILDRAEAFVAATEANIRHGGSRAYYRPSEDYIQIPDRERFTGTQTTSATESYYAVLLHELVHWSGHEARLNRDFAQRFGDEAYAMEELCAEIGAAFLCGTLQITNEPREDHTAYINHWLTVLKQDKRAVFTAASKAQEAARYLSNAGNVPGNGSEA